MGNKSLKEQAKERIRLGCKVRSGSTKGDRKRATRRLFYEVGEARGSRRLLADWLVLVGGAEG